MVTLLPVRNRSPVRSSAQWLPHHGRSLSNIAIIEGPADAGECCTDTEKDCTGALTGAAVCMAKMRAAIPTQTKILAASNAVATILRWVVVSAVDIDEFMTMLPFVRAK